MTTPLLMVAGAPLLVTRHPHYKTRYASRSSTALKTFADFAVHAKANGAGLSGFAAVTYRNHGFAQSRYKGTHSALKNVHKASPAEIACALSDGKRQQMLRTQQKPEELLQELMARFSQPQETVADLFSGTFSTATAFAEMPGGHFGHFVGCARGKVCAELATASLESTLAPLERDGRSDAVFGL